MSKVRVHELAKGLNLQSKELINIITGLGVEVKSHMSILEGKDLEIVIGHFRKIEAEKNKKDEKKVVKTENKPDKKKNNVNKERKDNFNKDNKNSKEGYKKDNKLFNKDNKGHKEGYNKDNKQNFSKDNKTFNKDKKGNYSKDKKEGFNKDKKQNFNKDNKPFNKDKKEGFSKDNRNFGRDKKDSGRKFADRNKEFLDDVVEVVDPAIEKRDARKTHLQGQEKNKKNKSLNEHKMREDRNPNLILKPAKKKNKANHKTKSDSDLEFENKVENVGEIKIPESITVKDFSESLGVSSSQVISKLIALGIMAGLNQEIDRATGRINDKINERYNKGKYEIRGRKFYWHHTKKIEVGKNWEKYKKSIETKNHDNTNSKIHFLEPLQEFNFEINFKDLNEEELGILLYSIEIEEGKSLHKLGKAKAYGFGSCEIKIEKCLIEDENKYTSFDKNNSFKEYSKEEYSENFIKIAKDEYELDTDRREEIKELKYILDRNNILNFSNDKSPFPEDSGKVPGINTLNWFMNNKEYNLPPISDYIEEVEKNDKGKK